MWVLRQSLLFTWLKSSTAITEPRYPSWSTCKLELPLCAPCPGLLPGMTIESILSCWVVFTSCADDTCLLLGLVTLHDLFEPEPNLFLQADLLGFLATACCFGVIVCEAGGDFKVKHSELVALYFVRSSIFNVRLLPSELKLALWSGSYGGLDSSCPILLSPFMATLFAATWERFFKQSRQISDCCSYMLIINKNMAANNIWTEKDINTNLEDLLLKALITNTTWAFVSLKTVYMQKLVTFLGELLTELIYSKIKAHKTSLFLLVPFVFILERLYG